MQIKKAEFLTSGVDFESFPEEGVPEFVFCGRSNVGKSSFINMLVNRKSLARTSSNPGKTQTINFYHINDSFYFVDVPGYGYAKVSKSLKATFGKMIEMYMKDRKSLRLVFLLVDFRHKPSEDDIMMYKFLKYYNRKVVVIATKSDKVKNSERRACKDTIINALELDSNDRLVITSSEKREGLGEVLTILDNELELFTGSKIEE
jgi:GTP-binding protein